MWAKWAWRPSRVRSVSSGVRQLAGKAPSLQWTCSGGGARVDGDAEVVAVDGPRVREAEVGDRRADRLDDLPRRDAGPLVVERGHVAAVALPALDPTRVDELDAVAAGRLQPPRDRVAHARRVAADEVEQRDVVAEQDEEERVDHRRVAQLAEDVAGGQRRRRRLDHGPGGGQPVGGAGGERR